MSLDVKLQEIQLRRYKLKQQSNQLVGTIEELFQTFETNTKELSKNLEPK